MKPAIDQEVRIRTKKQNSSHVNLHGDKSPEQLTSASGFTGIAFEASYEQLMLI